MTARVLGHPLSAVSEIISLWKLGPTNSLTQAKSRMAREITCYVDKNESIQGAQR